MASTLLIQKDSGGYFIFTLTVDSIVQEPIRNMRNDALCTGNLVDIKTANGANLVKYQNISIFDITLISGGTFTFTNVDVFLNKLIEVGFYDWLTFIGGGGGGGVNRFDQLIDTFDYFGNDSKAVRVNESQLKLETFIVYNYRNLTELEDTFDTIVPNKMLVTNNAGTKVELADLPTPPEQYLQSVGFFDYADLETQTIPLVLVSNVSKKLTNDTLGVSTNTSNAPYGVSSVWDSSTNTFNFSQLSIGDTIDIRFDVNVTTTVNNQIVKGYIKLGVGSPSEYILGIFGQQIKTPASNTQTIFTSIYIGNTDLIDYPSEVYLLTENSGSAKVNGWYCRVLRKGINIVDISINSDYHDATAKTTIVDADEIAGQNSASLFSTMKFTAFNLWNYIKSKADARYALITDLVNYYTKSEIDSKISSVYKYKGNVANYASLPSTGLTIGDVYNAIDTDINWAWTGTVWDNLGGTFDISSKQDVLTETNFGAFENSLTAKATPIDADFISIVDTADSNKAKKTTFTQLKAFFKSYYDGIYQAILVSGTNIKTVNGSSLLGSGNIIIDKSFVGLANIDNTSDLNKPVSTATQTFLNLKENKQAYIKYADDYANLTDAINATPAGGTLILGNHTYTGNISITRNNINIVGSKMPAFHDTLDQLVGGTIINGPFIIDGQNVSLSNLGIDSGTAQCVALNSGNPMEGLVMHDIAATNLNFNNSAENVIAIVKANTTMHAILLEGLANSTFRNIHGKGGDFGVVFKIADSNATDIYGYESRTTNIYIKSDSYAPTLRSNFNNLNSVSNVITASQPVAVHASTSNLFDVNVNNVNIYGGTRQFRLIASPASTPTYVMSNVNVSNAVMENGVDVGLDLYGVVYNSAFNNILVRNTVSGQGVFSDFNGRGINFNNIRFDDNSGNNLDTAIDIRSYSILNNIVSIRNTDQTSLGGINLNNFANTSKIGIYVGNLKINGVSVNKDKLTGQGTINYLPKYDSAGILKNSLFYDDGLNSGFNATPYSLGIGWSLFSTNNTTGSGFVNQVGSIPALRSISGGSNSSIIELRNLPLNFGTNASVKQIIHPSGGVSIGNSTDLGAGTLNVSSNVTTIAGTTANHAVIKSQLDLKADLASPTFTGTPTAPTATAGTNTTQVATTAFVQNAIGTGVSSGSYTPTLTAGTNITGLTLDKATYTKVGNIVSAFISVNFSNTAGNTQSNFTFSLPVNKTSAMSITIGNGTTITASSSSGTAKVATVTNNATGSVSFIAGAGSGVNGSAVISIQYNILD